MPLTHETTLVAARRWLALLPEAGVARARSILVESPQYADLSPTQYGDGLDWLRANEFVTPAGDVLGRPTIEDFVVAAVLSGRPAWFQDFDDLVTRPDELPSDVGEVISALGLTDERAYLAIRAAWGKVDAAARTLLGSQGELAVMQWLAELGYVARQVSLKSDSYGYDIAVDLGDSELHLEVKSTRRVNKPTMFLSRHEAETCRWDKDWRLVLAILRDDSSLHSLQTVSSQWILDSLPHDQSTSSRWESARLIPPSDEMTVGVKGLGLLQHG